MKLNINRKSLWLEIIMALLVMLFAYSAISKLLDYENFVFQLGRSPFITKFSSLISISLPIFELMICLALMFSKWRLMGLYASFFLMVLFTGYIYAMLHYSPFLPCSCGGVLSMMSWRQHLLFNCFFVMISVLGILLSEKRKSVLA